MSLTATMPISVRHFLLSFFHFYITKHDSKKSPLTEWHKKAPTLRGF